MRNNFRPNIRLATNVLLVIGTFSVAFNLAPMSRELRLKSLCNEYKYLLLRSAAFTRNKDNWDNKDREIYNWYNKSYIKKGKKIVSFYGMKPVYKDGMGATVICSYTNNTKFEL